MYFSGGGYNDMLFDVTRLRPKAKQVALALPKLMHEVGADFVVVTGKSGIAMAYATLMLIDFPLVVIRKEGETSHGNKVEGSPADGLTKYIILDDFVSTGGTVNTIVTELERYGNSCGSEAQLVGVLCYQNTEKTFAAYAPYDSVDVGLDSVPTYGLPYM